VVYPVCLRITLITTGSAGLTGMTTRRATETIRLEPHVKQRLTDVGRKSET